MAQGNYDHPSYITRQYPCLPVISSAGNGTVTNQIGFPFNTRVRSFTCTVAVAGTTAGMACQLLYIGTSVSGFTGTALTTGTTTQTLGSLTLGTAVAGAVLTSTDVDSLLIAGGVLAVKNGTDATGTYRVVLEIYLDPLASWTGPPGT